MNRKPKARLERGATNAIMAKTQRAPITTQINPDHPRKPRLAYVIATGLGLGYLPLTPGTWGSLLGILLAWIALHAAQWNINLYAGNPNAEVLSFRNLDVLFTVVVSI